MTFETLEKFHFRNSQVRREPCRFLWTDLVINWNGEVPACCQDYEGSMVVGDANLLSLKEIWNGRLLQNLRTKHLENKMDQIPLCKVCDYRSVWWLFK